TMGLRPHARLQSHALLFRNVALAAAGRRTGANHVALAPEMHNGGSDLLVKWFVVHLASLPSGEPGGCRAAEEAFWPVHSTMFGGKAMRFFPVMTLTLVVLAFLAQRSPVGAADATKFGPDPDRYQATVDRAVQFLASNQATDGSVSPQIGIGPTALAALSMIRSGVSPDDPQVAKSLEFLREYTQESGGIHAPGSRISVYETCIALVCFAEANRDGRYDGMLKHADRFLRDGQWGENRDKEKSDVYYGGAGYGGMSRPDLSNTAFLIEALKASGAKADDEAIQKALVFISRCQNLESEHNTTPFAGKVNDGGFYYTPVVGRQDEERQTAAGGLRSYGSMTYSGLKSMVYAGLNEDDPRVKATVQWIRDHYDVKNNPGMGDAGLYYYFHTFAKALDAMGVDEVEDANGVKHDWRRELAEELASRQQENGSWVNSNTRWMEGDPGLSTAFALLSLSYCRPKE
ncbi:MAG: prenyltransferase/squalene oxidase repeat-containing protein, partial [Patescibacteria group bacterium]|nr:prenyltransferase/squalene oxidase repeat-containing protein [Patescibacteria group bacterium]